MTYWLVKTEPSDYSFDDLLKDKKTIWSGVKNPTAQINLRAMKIGDQVLFYHTGDEKSVVGTAKVVKAAYPDPSNNTGKTVAVDLAPLAKLSKPVSLAQIKQNARFQQWALVKIGRLSVVPTTSQEFQAVLALAGASGR